jgi:hypothetical protein
LVKLKHPIILIQRFTPRSIVRCISDYRIALAAMIKLPKWPNLLANNEMVFLQVVDVRRQPVDGCFMYLDEFSADVFRAFCPLVGFAPKEISYIVNGFSFPRLFIGAMSNPSSDKGTHKTEECRDNGRENIRVIVAHQILGGLIGLFIGVGCSVLLFGRWWSWRIVH